MATPVLYHNSLVNVFGFEPVGGATLKQATTASTRICKRGQQDCCAGSLSLTCPYDDGVGKGVL